MKKAPHVWVNALICLACSLALIVISILSFGLCWQIGSRLVASVEVTDPSLLRQARFLRGLSLTAPLLFTWLSWSLVFNQLIRPTHNNLVYRLCVWLQRRGVIKNHWLVYRRVAKTMKAIARVG